MGDIVFAEYPLLFQLHHGRCAQHIRHCDLDAAKHSHLLQLDKAQRTAPRWHCNTSPWHLRLLADPKAIHTTDQDDARGSQHLYCPDARLGVDWHLYAKIWLPPTLGVLALPGPVRPVCVPLVCGNYLEGMGVQREDITDGVIPLPLCRYRKHTFPKLPLLASSSRRLPC